MVCAAVAASGPGCGADVDRGGPGAEGAGLTQAAADACTASSGPGAWSNQTFTDQTGRFHVEVEVTPSSTSVDAVVGLGDGSASAFSQLAAIIRFNPSGTIDARDGSAYRADGTYSYVAGLRYRVRFDVDVRSHSYSAWVRPAGFSSYSLIGHQYAFRTEQGAVSRLNDLASEVDSPSGTLEVCGAVAVADASTASGCFIASAGDGVITTPLPDAAVLAAVQFTARPSAANLDAVIGLSSGPASGFSDLATALRLSPAGVLDVRDGDTYRADRSHPYDLRGVEARLIGDVTSHTYSAFVRTGGADAEELARGYRFRTEQSAAAQLDHLNIIVDSAQGNVEVCEILSAASSGVAFSREGSYDVAPLAGDAALLSDGATTTRVDAGGHVVASVARGGRLATDVLGNIFIASVDGNTLAVDKYDPGFATTWHATGTVLAGAAITAMSADPTGAVLIGLVTPQDTSVSVFRFTAGGALASQLSAGGNAVAIDGDQPIVAWNDGPTFRVTRFAATGAIGWARAFAGNVRITAMAFDPGHG
ncbi:MAG TPA: hypothetical protein VK607_15935, partial [Kofleriaceae bacterium]|nr:hypothetical protein [Kofleriaceae bacterium]